MKGGLRSKLTISLWILSAFSTLTATILTGILWVRAQSISVDEQLQATAAVLTSLGISDFSELEDFEKFDQFIEDALQMEKVNKVIRIYNYSRKLIFSSVHQEDESFLSLPKSPILKPSFDTLKGKQGQFRSLIIPYKPKGKKRHFYLQITIPLPHYSQILGNLLWETAFLFGILIIFSFFLSAYLSRRLLKPVQSIADHLERTNTLQIDQWKSLPIDEHGEYLLAISIKINSLIEKTQTSVLQMKRISRFVAHEMRTPLTILQGEAETILQNREASLENYRNVLRSSLEEIQRMSEIVTTVLQVGKIEDGPVDYRPIDLNLKIWLEENVINWEKSLHQNLAIEAESDSDWMVRVDPLLLYRLVDNLIRNSHQASPNTICKLVLHRSNRNLKLTVMDVGPGMTDKQLESLNHFGRNSEVAGVGLSLCFAVAKICGIKLHFSHHNPTGLKVEIQFPENSTIIHPYDLPFRGSLKKTFDKSA